MDTNFPHLYKLAENGALMEWSIEVEGNVIRTKWGQEGGQYQTAFETVKEGKNPGKKNATTPEQQAVKEAKSKWEKQQKARKYATSREAALAGERSDLVQGGIDCMLAFPIEKKPKALKFPCAIQRKYDGHRILAHIKDGVCNLWTRSRNPIPALPHIQRALEAKFPVGEFWFDGEGYSMKVTFEELTSFIRSAEPKPGHEVVEYHVYDVVIGDLSYSRRFDWLVRNLDDQHPLILAPTVIVQDAAQMEKCFMEFLAAGYEGAMARNLDGLYVGKRSPDLLKLKKFQDAEFEVINVQAESRTVSDSGGTRTVVYPRFTCKLEGWTGPGDEDHEFTTTLNGEQTAVAVYLTKPHLAVGRMLTTKFQDWTSEGKPRFPKGLRFRSDI